MPTRRLTYKESVAYWVLPLFLLMWMHGQKGYNLRLSLSYIHLWFGGEEAFVWSIIYIEEHIRRFYPIVLLISNEIFDIYTNCTKWTMSWHWHSDTTYHPDFRGYGDTLISIQVLCTSCRIEGFFFRYRWGKVRQPPILTQAQRTG
jgi:hypothetical protein